MKLYLNAIKLYNNFVKLYKLYKKLNNRNYILILYNPIKIYKKIILYKLYRKN